MVKQFLIALSLFSYSIVNAQSTPVYYTPVTIPTAVWDEYRQEFAPPYLAQDMAALLQQATGKEYVAKAYTGQTGPGIYLLLDSNIKYSSNEAAVVSSNGSNTLTIKARYASGLSYGLYTYLDRLGFRFYLPGKEWTIVPTITTPFYKVINKEEWKPAFKHRFCTMSGAMLSVKGLDDERRNAKAWYQWYRRNRMGGEYSNIGGHIGELFNMMHQKEIEQDPTILAPEDGVNRKYSITAKLDPMNSKGVNMFVNWTIKQYGINNANNPNWMPWPAYQSVDPGDGLGYCHTPDCKKRFKSISDQVFYIANLAAKKIKNTYPDGAVSLYAYTERTDTPSIVLEPNVHVEVVATAFHNVATPLALLERWAKKTKRLTVYDYINIGVWNKEQPFFNLPLYIRYVAQLKKMQINGFTFEAAPNKFSSGLLQYFILKYLAEPYTDVQKEMADFCKNSFGPAANPMNELFTEWYCSNVKMATGYDEPTFHEDELGRFFMYLEQAGKAGGGPAVQQRLQELKAYTVYLSKYFEYKNDLPKILAYRNNPALLRQKSEEILQYTWSLYNTMIFHNTQLNDVLRWNHSADAAMQQQWDYAQSNVFKGIAKPLSSINTTYQQALATYLPKATANFMVSDALFDKAAALTPDSIRLRLIDEEAFVNYRFALQVYCPKPGKLVIQFDAGKSKRPNVQVPGIGYAAVVSDDYTYHTENQLLPNQPKGMLSFNLPKKGHYQLWLAQNNATPLTYTVLPGKNLLYINKKTIPMNGILLLDESDGKYKGNKSLAFYAPGVDSVYYNLVYPDCINYVKLYNSAGKPLPMDTKQSPFHISTPLQAADKNNFIYMTNDLFRWTPVLKNVPPYYFLLKPLKGER